MATTTIEKGQPGSRAWFRDSFVLHKLHSLSGVFPIGVFLIQHLLANSYSLRGQTEFNTVVKVFGYLPFVAILEIGLIFVPLLFHSIYGFFITAEMRNNVGVYQYGRNWLYWLQRWSGVIAFFYIVYHVWATTITRRLYEFGAFTYTGAAAPHEAGFNAISYQAMALRFAEPLYLLIYLIGISSAVFHFANGMFNFCIRWGLTIGAQAQKISAAVWSGLGVVLLVVGLWTSIHFAAEGRELRERGVTLAKVVGRREAAPVSETQPGRTPEPMPADASQERPVRGEGQR
jgi:succinate dehydrogenase/fumarate reductase cytochrome b subunit (b558 family)